MTNSLLKVVCGFALLGAFIALVAFRYAETVTENTPAISAEFEEPAISQRAATLDTKPSESANVNSVANYDQEARLAYEDYMANEYPLLSWQYEQLRLSRGKFLQDELDEYASYSEQAISNLIASGDLKAMQIGVDRLLEKGMLEEALSLSYYSVVHGSTYNLVFLGLHHLRGGLESPEVARTEDFYVGLAYHEVAAMRGDIGVLRSAFLEIEENGVLLSQNEAQRIGEIAEMLYRDLEEQREALGLPPFENETHPTVLTSMQLDFPLSKNPSGWGMQYYQ